MKKIIVSTLCISFLIPALALADEGGGNQVDCDGSCPDGQVLTALTVGEGDVQCACHPESTMDEVVIDPRPEEPTEGLTVDPDNL